MKKEMDCVGFWSINFNVFLFQFGDIFLGLLDLLGSDLVLCKSVYGEDILMK